MRRQSLFIAALTCFAAGCGDKDSTTSTAGNTTTSPAAKLATANAQPAQASTDAADSAGSSDSQTAQGGTTTPSTSKMARAAVIAETSLRAAQMEMEQSGRGKRGSEVAAQVTGSFEFQGCRARLDASSNANSSLRFVGGKDFDVNTDVALRANVVIDANSCGRGRRIRGDQTVRAMYQDGNRIVHVTDDLKMTMTNGDIVSIASDDSARPTYQLQSSSPAGMGNVELVAALNEHRTRKTAEGNLIFDLTVQTDANAPLDIINHYAEDANQAVVHTRTIVRGTTTVVHKVTGAIYKHTFDHLTRTTATCSCPTGGQINETVTHADGTSISRTYAFTACGTANIDVTASTDPNATVGTKSTVTFDSCQE